MTPNRFEKIKTVLSHRQNDLTVIMDGVHKPHNFNAIIRSCDSIGVGKIHYIPVKEGYRQLNYYAKGSQKWVEANRYESFSKAYEPLKAKGYQVLAAHFSDKAVDYRCIDYTIPTAIVMGTELEGVYPETAGLVDQHIIVPMQGMVGSLNVSVAAAVILFEAQKQRLDAGMYEKRQIIDKDYEKLLFEWSYPRLAVLHRKRNEPYPQLDDQGYIINSK